MSLAFLTRFVIAGFVSTLYVGVNCTCNINYIWGAPHIALLACTNKLYTKESREFFFPCCCGKNFFPLSCSCRLQIAIKWTWDDFNIYSFVLDLHESIRMSWWWCEKRCLSYHHRKKNIYLNEGKKEVEENKKEWRWMMSWRYLIGICDLDWGSLRMQGVETNFCKLTNFYWIFKI